MTLENLKDEQSKYAKMLKNKEMSKSTIRKYTLAIRNFISFMETTGHCTDISKECLIEYKEYLQNRYKPTTANLYIVALNNYFVYLGEENLGLKSINIQKQNTLESCFTVSEYKKMLEVAKARKNDAIYYIIRTLAKTGMRIAGISYLTVDVIKRGYFTVNNKGKIRCIVIPQGICDELMEFCKTRNITEGYVFKGQKPKKPISQSTIRRWLKEVAAVAEVDDDKAFPHNLRHLFAIAFLDKHRDLSELSDILGHTGIETTRIYTRTGIEEKRKKMDIIEL